MSASVDTNDVQSLVFSGHSRLPYTLALRLNVEDANSARAALRGVAGEQVSFGIPPTDRKSAIQILLSAAGLSALEVSNEQLGALGRPYCQGMVTPHRSRGLGDRGRNDPAKWRWSDHGTHAWLLVYAPKAAEAVTISDNCMQQLQPGWMEHERIALRAPANKREPFGFLDGIGRKRVELGDGRSTDPEVEVFPTVKLFSVTQMSLASTLSSHPWAGTAAMLLLGNWRKTWRASGVFG